MGIQQKGERSSSFRGFSFPRRSSALPRSSLGAHRCANGRHHSDRRGRLTVFLAATPPPRRVMTRSAGSVISCMVDFTAYGFSPSLPPPPSLNHRPTVALRRWHLLISRRACKPIVANVSAAHFLKGVWQLCELECSSLTLVGAASAFAALWPRAVEAGRSHRGHRV